jgi:FAD linked oxidases, C-terminal domain
MSIEPTLEDQELLEETLRRLGSGMSRREFFSVMLSTAGFLAAVAGVWLIQDPDSFSVLPGLLCVLVLALAMRVRFDTPLGFTVPTTRQWEPRAIAMHEAIKRVFDLKGRLNPGKKLA